MLMDDVVFVIPARRNSKSIKFKNRQVVAGKNLVQHAVDFCEKFKPAKLIISTDDEYFFEDEHLSFLCDIRPKTLGSDTATVADVVIDLITKRSLQDSFIVVLEPTCIPRHSRQLSCLTTGEFISSGCTSLASFTNSPVIKEKIWTMHNGLLKQDPNLWLRRQEYAPQYMLSGHYYGFWGRDLPGYYPGVCGDPVFPIFIEEPSIDIDYVDDLKRAEKILQA